jgi:ATP-dependent Clp protease ATP-binding subunit ClpX
MENVKLEFKQDALEALAEKSVKRGTGARGLRSILENMMMDIMYDIPSQPDIVGVTINADCVKGLAEPIVTRKELLIGELSAEIAGELE